MTMDLLGNPGGQKETRWHFSSTKRKNCEIICPEKISVRNEENISPLSNKGKLKEIISNKLSLKESQRNFSKQERNN